ncbi:electron transfer flavoprotein [Eggerthellaceae bacterium zg-1084]|uniref:electron transfer flavoprotein n=1 Tax=Berryella wangjianweii TaxID=2734634 RepID=UPI001552235E|nr:electron transfer flavoprotein [Berryella wangjianweii]NPD31541.1 electron transfer flavoprotein [Berryella wangjianweii]NPD32964.1 electron transfer flavoprotein [Eggerthellaceae bacterium zg-997]
MDILVAFKVVPDDQDIQVAADRSLDYAKAKSVVSAYDLNALEAAAQLASQVGDATVKAVTVGGSDIDDSKLKKNVLARGVDELFMVADDAAKGLDAGATADHLAALVGKVGSYDVIICGDGSADNYAQQVDVQLAARLGVPVVNGVVGISLAEGVATVERVLEDVVETVTVPLPAVLSVTPDAATPRIPGMKDILAAGKKPMNVDASASQATSTTSIVSCLAPESMARKGEVLDASADGAIEQFAAAIKSAL